MKYMVLLSLLMSLFSCSNNTDEVCYRFDIRQCQTDLFAEDVIENGTVDNREDQLKTWLENQGIQTKQVKLELDVLDAVCEACDTCPTGDQYVITIAKEDENKLSDLRLLNLTSC